MKYKIKDYKVDFRLTEDVWRENLQKKVSKRIKTIEILRKSIDARKNLMFVYHLMIETEQPLSAGESKKLNAEPYHEEKYKLPCHPEIGKQKRRDGLAAPVIIGCGPAGLFAAFILAECGFSPILLERGEAVEERVKTVATYNRTGQLNPQSNIQFGEGGAGTFSDGKLNTGVKDALGRRDKILRTFVDCGAKENILYEAKPHIGTDYLIEVVKNMRHKIEEMGGKIFFGTKVEELLLQDDKIIGVRTNHKDREEIRSSHVVLAIGHSARDTFEMLLDKKIMMEPKPFAVGLRVEHKQEWIDKNQYGSFAGHPHLEAAEYKLTHQATNGRRVYSFCMCPGGRVVNSASEPQRLVCNGMSYEARDLENSNSAILIGIDERDYGQGILAGLHYQRELEEKAFVLGGGTYAMPVECYGDFKDAKQKDFKESSVIRSSLECDYRYANLRSLFSGEIAEAFCEAMEAFGKKIEGFAHPEVLLTGVESRSSSPVRIVRNEEYHSQNCKGLYPCGEGAGYAGGIMSAAIDGIKVAEKVINSMIGEADE